MESKYRSIKFGWLLWFGLYGLEFRKKIQLEDVNFLVLLLKVSYQKQYCVALSSMAKYVVICVAQLLWDDAQTKRPLYYNNVQVLYNNVSTMYLTKNLMHHYRTKHRDETLFH